MLVPTTNYLVPDTDASSAFNSSNSSVSIPNIPSHRHPQAMAAAQRNRRRAAPYPSQQHIGTNNVFQHPDIVQGSDAFIFHDNTHPIPAAPQHQHPHPHPHPQPSYRDTPNQHSMPNQVVHVHPYLAFAPGAHGTILDPFTTNPSAQSEYAHVGELTATHIACMAATGAYHFAQSPASDSRSATPKADDINRRAAHTQQPAFVLGSSSDHDQSAYPEIKMPQVPFVPPSVQPNPNVRNPQTQGIMQPLDPTSAHAQSQVQDQVPFETFPTPSELLEQSAKRRQKELDAPMREAEAAARVMEAHKAEALNNGYIPVEPESISTHEKKRLYLESLEQYVVYLHEQIRLTGSEPVPVERLTTSRGLSSRSIRTLIVYLRQTIANVHSDRRTAEADYEMMRRQLEAESGAGPAIPEYMQMAINHSEALACSRHDAMDDGQSTLTSRSSSMPVLSTPIPSAIPRFEFC